MRLSLSDIEKIVDFAKGIFESLSIKGEKIEQILDKILEFFKQNERTISARIRLRLAKMIEEIESKDKMKKEDKIKLQTLKEVMKIIEEEEKKIG